MSPMRPRLDRKDACVLVVDVQERLTPVMWNFAPVEKYCRAMILAARELDLPVLASEQYPKGLGGTVPEILKPLEGKKYQKVEKVSFSCARDEGFLQAVAAPQRKQVVIVGMETHVCVYQTSVDLTRAGYSVFVLDDAVSSRYLHNYQSGLQSLRDAGCTVFSTETAVFQLLKVAATPEFKKVASLIR